MKYVYEFSVWPSETWGFKRSLFELFRSFAVNRIAMEFTEAEFELFRSSLNHDGFTLREVSRVPFHEPESVL